jgi:hypothetical protein
MKIYKGTYKNWNAIHIAAIDYKDAYALWQSYKVVGAEPDILVDITDEVKIIRVLHRIIIAVDYKSDKHTGDKRSLEIAVLLSNEDPPYFINSAKHTQEFEERYKNSKFLEVGK